MKVLFKGRMLPKQFDTSRDAGRMYLIILRIKSNQINLALRVRSLITGLSTCLLQQHSLALPSWHLIALTFTRWLTTPEGSYEANAGFHWYVSSIRFHWGGEICYSVSYLRWISEPQLVHSLSRGMGWLLVPSLSKEGFHGGGATPVRWGFHSWRHRRGAMSTAMTVNIWRGILLASAPLQRKSTSSPRALTLFKSSGPANVSPNETNRTDML